ncbi:MAG TPA: hypothetical protein VI756_30580 [Blastocatellia bacterium]
MNDQPPETQSADEDLDVDGCASDISDDQTTADEDLPAAEGGIA